MRCPTVIHRALLALAAAAPLVGSAHGMDTADIVLGPDIQFVSQAANFQPLGSNYPPEELTPPPPPSAPPPPPIPPQPPQSMPTEGVPIESAPIDGTVERYEYDGNAYSPAPILEPSDCDSSAVFSGDVDGVRARQIPDNWLWGCNGSAYRTGPGTCDDWNVGCRWETSVDGIMLFRQNADLVALRNAVSPTLNNLILHDQFDYAPGGRVSFTGRYPKWAGYEVQAAYEGIDQWNASMVSTKAPVVPAGTQQSSLFYTSSLQSAELNILRRLGPGSRWFGGVRYIKFDDEINYSIDQDSVAVNTDSYMINDLENNLIGFQIGGRHDLWQPHRRFTLEGFVNGGVYYNGVKRTDVMSSTTTTGSGETTLYSSVVAEPSQVAYVGEASLTAVCRLNRCWQCRAGYQVLWIDGLSLAEDAFLDTNRETRSLTFQGWHAGVECRR